MLYHRTQTVTENLSYISKKNNKTYELHSVLTSNLKHLRNGCNSYTQQEIINRDKNSCLNMKMIFQHYLKTSERIERFRRSVDSDKTMQSIRNQCTCLIVRSSLQSA